MGQHPLTMISIKYYQIIKKLLFFALFRKIYSRIYSIYYGINIHDTVRIFGSGNLNVSFKSHIDEYVTIYLGRNSSVSIGSNVTIGPYCKIVVNDNDNIEIQDDSSIQSRCEIHGNVVIGKSTLIAPNCFMSSGSHSFSGDVNLTIKQKDKLFHKKSMINIGDDCWIGVNSVILPGAIIGDKCVIGANVVFSGGLLEKKLIKVNRQINITEDIKYNEQLT